MYGYSMLIFFYQEASPSTFEQLFKLVFVNVLTNRLWAEISQSSHINILPNLRLTFKGFRKVQIYFLSFSEARGYLSHAITSSRSDKH